LSCLVLQAHEHAFEQSQRFKGMLMCMQNKTTQHKTRHEMKEGINDIKRENKERQEAYVPLAFVLPALF
jgi:hypothetical protein